MTSTPNSIAELVEHWRRRIPGNCAVRLDDHTRTWTELADRVARNVAWQRTLGLRPGDHVAYLDKNSLEWIETALACAAVGTILTGVNHRLNSDGIRFVLEDAKTRLLIVGAEFRDLVPDVRDYPVVEAGEWTNTPPENVVADADPDRCLFQLYTSGTTASPRGVMLSDRSMTAQCHHIAGRIGLDADSVGLVALPMFHVAAMAWALTLLVNGAETVLMRDADPATLLEVIERDAITHVPLVPAVYQAMLRVPGADKRDYSRLKALVYGASPMPAPLLTEIRQTFDAPLMQGYGMTETSSVITMLDPADHRDPRRLDSAGTPLPGVRLRIAPDGEVQVESAQNMIGYWTPSGRPDRSAFTADGWLRTGDLGRLDDDGYLYLTGRAKDIIISGGENIAAAEVERVLGALPNVREVAVIGVPDPRWQEVPLAVVVPEAGFDHEDFLAAARARLTRFQVPVAVRTVDALPRNAVGKVDKAALDHHQ